MAVSKVILNSTTLIDATTATAAASDITSPKTAMLADGVMTTGTGTSGGGTVEIKDVVFWDYDGTPVYSYTLTEANALTALPANPSHTGLTVQGWNWTLQEIKDQITACPGGTIDIGQSYVTDDGKTRIYIEIPASTPSSCMTFYVRLKTSAVGNCTIDWGDNSTEATTQTNAKNYSHTYATTGSYTIALTVSTGTIEFACGSSDGIFGPVSNGYNRNRIKKVEVGTGMASLGSYAFANCVALESVTIPTSVTGYGDHIFANSYGFPGVVFPRLSSYDANAYGTCFQGVTSLRFFSLPKGMKLLNLATSKGITRGTITTADFRDDGVFQGTSIQKIAMPSSGLTEIKKQTFHQCYRLKEFTIPSSVTTIGLEAFRECQSLATLTIPASVTDLTAGKEFYNLPGMREYHFLGTTPPAFGDNMFWNINANCVIYVPYSADHSILAAYQSASNMSTFASYMQEEPQ